VITTSGDPLNGALLQNLGEQARIDSLATRKVTLLPMDRIVVHQLHMLLQTMVHERDSISSAWVIRGKFVALVLVPLDLVSSDAVHASGSHAVRPTSAEEPKAQVDGVIMNAVLDG